MIAGRAGWDTDGVFATSMQSISVFIAMHPGTVSAKPEA